MSKRKGGPSPILADKLMRGREAGARHQRRRADKLDRLKAKLEAQGYSFPERTK